MQEFKIYNNTEGETYVGKAKEKKGIGGGYLLPPLTLTLTLIPALSASLVWGGGIGYAIIYNPNPNPRSKR